MTRDEMLRRTEQYADAMAKRILSGEIYKEYITQQGERVIITITSSGKYGYAAYYDTREKTPYFYAEADYLFEDLDKNTDSHGALLPFATAQNRISRNLLGIFSEYRIDEIYGNIFTIAIQYPDEGPLNVSQRGKFDNPIEKESVILFQANFKEGAIGMVGGAAIYIDKTGKPNLRVGVTNFKPDGSLDYDRLTIREEQASIANAYFSRDKRYLIDEDEAEQRTMNGAEVAQSVFFELFDMLGLPRLEGTRPCNLIDDAFKGKDVSKYVGEAGSLNPEALIEKKL